MVWKKKKGRTPKSPARNKKYSHVYLQINTHNCISLILINLQTLLTRQAVLLKYLLPYCSLTNQLCYNLIPVIEGVSPELCVPGSIYGIKSFVLILEPYTKLLLTVVTVTVSAVLVIDVPYRNIFIAAIAFCKLCRKSFCVLLISFPVCWRSRS